MTPERELVQWVINQGAAVAFGLFVLIRLDQRIGELLLAVQKLTDQLAEHQRTA